MVRRFRIEQKEERPQKAFVETHGEGREPQIPYISQIILLFVFRVSRSSQQPPFTDDA
jgi:hypothetical protein